MKSIFISLILTIFAISSFGQISYEKGYFINNENQRIDCFIKNYDRDNNPTKFKYKLTDSDEPKNGDILSVKEFGIVGISKFIRITTKIDRSTKIYSNVSDSKDPTWSVEQLFLKVLLEGKASLYSYTETDDKLFFYSLNDTLIEQLVRKEYKVNNTNEIKTNNIFRLQLWENVKCSDAEVSSVEKLSYTQRELENYFINYNSCMNSPTNSYIKKDKRDFFNLRITPGLNFSSFGITRDPNMVIDFKNKVNLRLGIDAEIILPFNRNKWAVVVEPTFNSFESEAESTAGKVNIVYNYIEFPFGLRYYCFLKSGLRLFFNGYVIPGTCINFDNSIDFEYPAGSITIDPFHSIHNYSIGSGLDYRNISLEMRFYSTQDPFFPSETWTSQYKRFALIVGYRIL